MSATTVGEKSDHQNTISYESFLRGTKEEAKKSLSDALAAIKCSHPRGGMRGYHSLKVYRAYTFALDVAECVLSADQPCGRVLSGRLKVQSAALYASIQGYLVGVAQNRNASVMLWFRTEAGEALARRWRL